MKTFIIEWNPQESSFGLEDFSHAISSMEFGDLPWMFRRRCGIRSGDNFYLVKVGDGLEGIVMKGFFRTQPEAYSGDADGGFRTFLRPTFMIDVRRNENIIRKEMLSASLPALPWGDGVFLMNSHECDVLSGMWEEYLSGIPEEAFSEGALGKRERPDAILDDALILAVGSTPLVPPIPGIDGDNVIIVNDYYLNKDKVADSVVVLGGGLAGCECAIHLGMEGKKVELVEMRDTLAVDCNIRQRPILMRKVAEFSTAHTEYVGQRITADGVLCKDKDGHEVLVPGKTVICALGQRANRADVDALRGCAPFVREVGDCVRPANITKSIYEAYHAALDI